MNRGVAEVNANANLTFVAVIALENYSEGCLFGLVYFIDIQTPVY